MRFVSSSGHGHGSDGRFANTSRIMTLWSGPLLEQCRRMLPNLVFARVEVSRNRTGGMDVGAGTQTSSWVCMFGGAGLIFDDEALGAKSMYSALGQKVTSAGHIIWKWDQGTRLTSLRYMRQRLC